MKEQTDAQDESDHLKWITSQVPGKQISQLLVFLILNAQVRVHNLGCKHSSDGKSGRVSRELVLLLNVTVFQVNFSRMLLKSKGFLQHEKGKKKSGSTIYFQYKLTD